MAKDPINTSNTAPAPVVAPAVAVVKGCIVGAFTALGACTKDRKSVV